MTRMTHCTLMCMLLVFMNSMQAKLGFNASYCGLSNSPKIVGGTKVGQNEFPWMAFISSMTAKTAFMCGGTLVTNRHVLTAAHCMMNAKVDKTLVFLGGKNPSNHDADGVNGVKASAIKTHPKYNTSSIYDYDIAIISLNQSVKFPSKLQPICLPPANLNYEGMTGTVLGWGRLGPNIHSPNGALMKVNVPIMDNISCNEMYNPVSVTITPRMLCAGQNGSNSCMGDSGGPLMLFLSGRYHIIGIVSFGDDSSCGSAGIPGVYARVNAFSNFIADVIFEKKDS